MQEALHRRRMGEVIREYRQHPAHGRRPLPQGTVAAWAGLSQAQLSRIEHGSPIVHLDRLVQWASLLGIPAQHLWFALPGDELAGGDTEDMRRRSFLTTAGVSLVIGWTDTSAPTEPLAQIHADVSAVLLTGDDGSSSNEQLVTRDEVARQVAGAWKLRQRARYAALGRLLPELLRQTQAGLYRVTTDSERREASLALTHTYNTASSLLKRLGDGPLALVAADRAVLTARGNGEALLVAAAQYRLANVLLAAGRPSQAQAVAVQAADLIAPTTSHSSRSLAVWGSLLLTAAVAAARDRQESTAWELMGEARTASRFLGADHADIYAIFGPTNVAIHGVQVAVELGHGRDALRRSHGINADRLPPSLLERRGQFLIDVAHGHVLEGDDTAATETLTHAIATAPEEVRLNHEAVELTRTLMRRGRASTDRLRDLAQAVGVSA